MSNNLLVLLLIAIFCAWVTVDAQESSFGTQQNFGPTFEEVIVSSDLNVRRKSKESRGGKKLLTNIPLATTTTTTQTQTETQTSGNPIISRLISDDGASVYQEKRNRRNTIPKYRLNLGPAEWLLDSRN